MRLRYLLDSQSQPANDVGPFRRTVLLFAIGLVHLLAILWLAAQAGVEELSQSSGQVVELIDVSGGPEPARQATPEPKPTDEVLPPIALEVEEVVDVPEDAAEAVSLSLADGSAGQGSAGGCGLAMEIGQAIQRDAVAMTELGTMPRPFRTNADAVMLWDGGWLESQAAAARTLRAVIMKTVSAAPPECRNAAVIGPQLVPVPEPSRTTMVVIGSGAWRWADLIRPDACSPEQPLCRGRPLRVEPARPSSTN